MKGKLKLIPLSVEKLTQHMCVVYNGNIKVVELISSVGTKILGVWLKGHTFRIDDLNELKELVIEYQEPMLGLEHRKIYESKPVKRFTLDYSQWESSIYGNNEEDVEFEIIEATVTNPPIQEYFAKIIPKEKKMYSEEDMIEFGVYLVGYGKNTISNSLKKFNASR